MIQHPDCDKLTVVQGLENGFLGGPYEKGLTLPDGIAAEITQIGKRTIELSSSHTRSGKDLFCAFQSLEKLLMLFDGRFYPIEHLHFGGQDQRDPDQDDALSHEILDGRLWYYKSRDCFQNTCFKLISFQDVLTEDLFRKWSELQDQMDIAYQVLLYSMSDSRIPVDMMLAFLVELAEPFVEQIKDSTYFCQSLQPGQRGTTLKMCLDSIITHFGTDVFGKELNGNYTEFLDTAVGSRVRIMHIKKNQGKYFSAKDSVRYSMKLSLLYRITLFELLGISYAEYKLALQKAVSNIDNW